MFGEELMCGTKEISIDEKNRIILPKFTKAEKDDKLVIQKEEQELKILPKNKIAKIIEEMEKALEQAKDISECNTLKERIDKLYFSILSDEECDKSKRIILPDFFDKSKSNKIMAIGFGDHVKLYTLKRYNELSNK